MTPLTVERRRELSPAEFERGFVGPGQPVILTGIADKWRAVSRWTPAYFRQRFGEVEVAVEVWGDTRRAPRTPRVRVRTKKLRMAEFVDALEADSSCPWHYLAQQQLLNAIPELREDLEPLDVYMKFPFYYPERIRRRLRMAPLFFVGSRDIWTKVHFDLLANLFVQIHGRKRFRLFAPDQSPYLYYPHREYGARSLHFSPVDIEHPDLQQFPLFDRARSVDVVIEPGQILFIPPLWWHEVTILETAISVSHFWTTMQSYVLRGGRHLWWMARTAFRHRIRAARGQPRAKTAH